MAVGLGVERPTRSSPEEQLTLVFWRLAALCVTSLGAAFQTRQGIGWADIEFATHQKADERAAPALGKAKIAIVADAAALRPE